MKKIRNQYFFDNPGFLGYKVNISFLAENYHIRKFLLQKWVRLKKRRLSISDVRSIRFPEIPAPSVLNFIIIFPQIPNSGIDSKKTKFPNKDIGPITIRPIIMAARKKKIGKRRPPSPDAVAIRSPSAEIIFKISPAFALLPPRSRNTLTPFLGGSRLLYKIWTLNYFFKRCASYHFKA